MSGYPSEPGLVVAYTDDEQDWLEDTGGLSPGVNACGDGMSIKVSGLMPLICALKDAFPAAETIKDYADAIIAITGNTPLSGTAFLAGCEDMTGPQEAAFALKMAQSMTGNSAIMNLFCDNLPVKTNGVAP